jgi:hypothetical protein
VDKVRRQGRQAARRAAKAPPAVAPDPAGGGIGTRSWYHRCANKAIVFLSLSKPRCDRCGLLQEAIWAAIESRLGPAT